MAARNASSFAIAFFDMDRFKDINDAYGHAEGDEALRSAAAILGGVFRSGDVAARFGGDEFIVLLPDTGESALPPLLSRLRAAAAEWNAASGKPWRLSFSIGTAIFDPKAPESLESVIARADERMYEDKKARRVAEGR
jgi:diguanylate cyclase (GGDEF)-like protein